MTVRRHNAYATAEAELVARPLYNGTGGTIRFFTGAKPATVDAAVTGTLLATIPTATFFATAAVNGSFSNTVALASNAAVAGTIGYARISNTANAVGIDEDVYDSAAVPGTGGIGITGGTALTAGTVINIAIGGLVHTVPTT